MLTSGDNVHVDVSNVGYVCDAEEARQAAVDSVKLPIRLLLMHRYPNLYL
jgi:hypothetical protein